MEVLRQKGENLDFKAMGLSTALLSSSARAHNSPQPASMCCKGAYHANGLKHSPAELERIELTTASIFLKPSELKPDPIELERTRPEQPSAHHDAPHSRH
jgi:hypothetical protein